MKTFGVLSAFVAMAGTAIHASQLLGVGKRLGVDVGVTIRALQLGVWGSPQCAGVNGGRGAFLRPAHLTAFIMTDGALVRARQWFGLVSRESHGENPQKDQDP